MADHGFVVHLSAYMNMNTLVAEKTESSMENQIKPVIEEFKQKYAELIRTTPFSQYQLPERDEYKIGFIRTNMGAGKSFLFIVCTTFNSRLTKALIEDLDKTVRKDKPSNMYRFLQHIFSNYKSPEEVDLILKNQKEVDKTQDQAKNALGLAFERNEIVDENLTKLEYQDDLAARVKGKSKELVDKNLGAIMILAIAVGVVIFLSIASFFGVVAIRVLFPDLKFL